jgi:hypothetical protein
MPVPCYIYHSFPLERDKQEKEKGKNPSEKKPQAMDRCMGRSFDRPAEEGGIERDKQVINDKHVTSPSHPRVHQASLPGKQEKESNR